MNDRPVVGILMAKIAARMTNCLALWSYQYGQQISAANLTS